MYNPPIGLTLGDLEFQTLRGLRDATERTILQAVQQVEVTVDRDELIAALKYDRDQYAKGYRDGSMSNLVTAKWIEHHFTIECSKCHTEFSDEVMSCEQYGWFWERCPKCGANMTGVIEGEP